MSLALKNDKYWWAILGDVLDPEVPVLSVLDLGIVRDLSADASGHVIVDVTPTYSGCPATLAIENNIKTALYDAGASKVTINTVLSPAWTSDWISAEGRKKLFAYGIAPPKGSANKSALLGDALTIQCPNCKSENTEKVSEFGSTACKSLFRCKSCLEPFEYFKCI